ncbi:MAG TPA: hypothetical protein VN653_17930 [Anaerolineales bacterium]|nr:hypothetical protein [Anaerolineales bacterium]
MNPPVLDKKEPVTLRVELRHRQWVRDMAQRTKRKEIVVWEQMFIKCQTMSDNEFWSEPKLKRP